MTPNNGMMDELKFNKEIEDFSPEGKFLAGYMHSMDRRLAGVESKLSFRFFSKICATAVGIVGLIFVIIEVFLVN